MKRTCTVVSFVLIFMLSMFFMCGYDLVSAKDIKNLSSRRGVKLDKNWTVIFNKTIDKSTVNTNNIIITDTNNKKVDIDVKVGEDKKSIIITPKNNFSYGKTYYLIIKSDIKTTDGKKLSRDTRKEFTTIRPFPIDIEKAKDIENKLTVCIDPGQLWSEYVKSSSGTKASDINLGVALKLGKILEEKGVNVIYTRKSSKVSWNSETDKVNRIKISEEAEADLHLTINCNAYDKERVNGIETYYLQGNNEYKELAQNIQQQLIKCTNAIDRGIKPIEKGKNQILAGTSSAGVQIELGFITNNKEEQLLKSSSYQSKLAEAIAKALEEYAGKADVEDTTSEDKAIIESVNSIDKTIKQGESFTPPKSVKAIMSDGSTSNVEIEWTDSNIDVNKPGNYYYYGTVDGYNGIVKLTLKIEEKVPEKKLYKVCINPSRGGSDIGITGVTGAIEKDINLDVALKAGKILESKGIEVIYTRKSDYVPWNSSNEIQERVKIANNAKVDLMVSIGGNSFSTESSHGIETYYLDGKGEGKELAQFVENELIKQTGSKYRGVKGVTHLNTLKLSNAVSIWAAIGFLTNKEEESVLKTSEYRQRCAEAIANGVMKYIDANPDGPTIGQKENEEKIYFDDIVQHIKVGQQYTLPQKVNVTLENGVHKSVNVTWNTSTVKTTNPGLYRFEGKINESKKIVSLVLIINQSGSAKFKVCVDPGHGGYDPGAIGPSGLFEKSVTLPISLKVGNYLVKNGVDVVYTRASDNVSWPSSEKPDLRARCNIANNANVDLYVSVHANTSHSRNAYGIETYYYRYSSSSKKVAQIVQNELVKQTGAYNRGARGAGFYVIKYSDAPAILVETGFLSNYSEEKKLGTKDYQTKLAKGIAIGILKSLGINNYVLD